MRLATSGFGYDGITVISRGEIRPGIKFDRVRELGQGAQYWHYGQAHVDGVKGSLSAWWAPRRWKVSIYPSKVRFNPSATSYDGWETWELLNQVVSFLPGAPVVRVDSKLDLEAPFKQIAASLYFKGRNRVKTSAQHPHWLAIGNPDGVQLVIYDKSAHLGLPGNTVTRVEIRQRFETVTTRGRRRPAVREFLAGECVDVNPFRDVRVIDPARLPEEIRQRAQRVGINLALQDQNIDPTVRAACRLHILRHGNDRLFRLYKQEAQGWHESFNREWDGRVQKLA